MGARPCDPLTLNPWALDPLCARLGVRSYTVFYWERFQGACQITHAVMMFPATM